VRAGLAVCLLALVLVAGCGGDDDGNGGGDEDEPKTLEFERVQSVTAEHLTEQGEDNFTGCENPDWSAKGAAEEKRAQKEFNQAERVELLRCPPPSLLNSAVYLEFSDAEKAQERIDALYGECLGDLCSAWLLAEETAVVVPGEAEDGRPYVEALKADCDCGEIGSGRPAP
jgi:hypothetical protein